jgi:hypothetical protein
MTARKTDCNGYFEIDANPISRVGVFDYTAASTRSPGWESNPHKLVKVYRPEEELSDPEALDSFKLVPWVNDHTMLGNPAHDAGLTPAEKKGVHGTTGERVFFDKSDRTMKANLRLWSPTLDDAIDAGKKDLSLGYRCVYDFTPGEFEGKRYDAIQRRLRGNHLASVDFGRMGKGVSVLDHATFTFDSADLKEVQPMPKATRRIVLAAKLGVAVDALAATLCMDKAEPAALAAWNLEMDAEVMSATKDAPPENTDTPNTNFAAAVEMVKSVIGPVAELQTALAALSATPMHNSAAPDPLDPPDDSVMDSATIIDPATGKPKMNAKTPAAALAACDSAIKALKGTSAAAHKALPAGTAAPAELVALDAAIVQAETTYTAAMEANKTAPAASTTALDAALTRLGEVENKLTALDSAAKPLTFADVAKQIAARDTLAKQVSPFVGSFDHADMTAADVAKYACDKLELKAPEGSELAYLTGFLTNRSTPESVRPASAFALDAAVKPSSRAADFIAGKAEAA